METRYVIEARGPDGRLDFAAPQPELVFGMRAIQGITADEMARHVFARRPDLPFGVMHGGNVAAWPALVDPRFSARVKYW